VQQGSIQDGMNQFFMPDWNLQPLEPTPKEFNEWESQHFQILMTGVSKRFKNHFIEYTNFRNSIFSLKGFG
jgi:hypothetical protein